MNCYRYVAGALLGASFVAALTGCGAPGHVEEKTIEVKENSGLERAKGLLNNYAKGQPLGSETTSFPGIVEEVHRADPTRAAILEKGFADLQKPKANTVAKAKDILKQLEPRPNG
jgi:hypothetical protein